MIRGIVTALRHPFYVQAANSHKWTSQWFWEIISWTDDSQPHTTYPAAAAHTAAVLVNFYRLGSPPQGGSWLQEPHPQCLLGGLVLNPKHEWIWMSVNVIIEPNTSSSRMRVKWITSFRIKWNTKSIHLLASLPQEAFFLGWCFELCWSHDNQGLLHIDVFKKMPSSLLYSAVFLGWKMPSLPLHTQDIN